MPLTPFVLSLFGTAPNRNATKQQLETGVNALANEVDNRRINSIRDAGVLPLTTATGTANALVSSLAASVSAVDVPIGPGALVELRPSVNNTGPATLTIGDLGPWPILRQGGFPLGANDLKAGKSQLLRRAGSTWTFATGEMTRREVELIVGAAQSGMPALDFEDLVDRVEQAVIDAQAAVSLNYATFAALMADTTFYTAGAFAYVRQDGTSYRLLTAAQPGRHYTAASGQGIMCLGGKLLVAAGQSNIAASNAAAAGGDLTVDPRIRFWNGTAWVTWDVGSAALNWASQPGRNNIAFQAAKQALRDGVPCVYVVLDAHPGNTIDQWIANATTGANGPNMTSLLTKVSAAMGAAEIALAGISTASGFLWGQGENNGGAVYDFAAYKARWDWIKAKLRAQSWFPATTPITALSMPPQPSSRTMDRFFKGHLPFDGDTFTSFTDTSDQPAPEGNLMHWTGEAMDQIGRRAWEKIARGGDTLPAPGIIQADIWRYQPEPVNGFGVGWNWVAGESGGVPDPSLDRFIFGTVSNASGASIAQNFMAVWRSRALIQMVQHTEYLGGMTLKSYTGSNFASASHAVNTDPNKKAGTTYWDSVNSRLMVATGTGPTAGWAQFNADATITPA